jgi:hypothetical protein
LTASESDNVRFVRNHGAIVHDTLGSDLRARAGNRRATVFQAPFPPIMTTEIRGRLWRLARLLVPFVSLEVAVQLATLVVGFLIVRVLPVKDFAIYALVTALQGTLAVLSDAGVSTVLVARAGAMHSDRKALAELVASARRARRMLEVLALLLCGPLLFLWLRGRSVSPADFATLVVIVALGLHLQVTSSVYAALPTILLEPHHLQMAQLIGSLIRLAAIGLVLLLAPVYLLALLTNILGIGMQAWLLRRYANRRIPLQTPASEQQLAELSRFVRRQFVNTFYYAFASQLTIWLIGFKGSTRSIAEVGALGRLGNVIAVGQSSLSTLAVPRLAREVNPVRFLRRYLGIVLLVAVCSLLLIVCAILSPSVLLWSLGPKYQGLSSVLPLAIGSYATFWLSSTVFSLNSSKAWVERVWPAIPLVIASQIGALFFLDVGTVRGAIWFGWVGLFPPLLVNGVIAISRLSRWLRASSATN